MCISTTSRSSRKASSRPCDPTAPVRGGLRSVELKLVEARPPRPDDRRGQARRRLRGGRRGRGEARRQEGEGRPSGACSTAPPSRRSSTTPPPCATPITFEAEAEKPTRACEEQEGHAGAGRGRTRRTSSTQPADARRRAIEDDEPEPTSGRRRPRRTGRRRPRRSGRAVGHAGDAAARSRRRQSYGAVRETRTSDVRRADEGNGRPAPRIHVPPS